MELAVTASRDYIEKRRKKVGPLFGPVNVGYLAYNKALYIWSVERKDIKEYSCAL